MKPETAVLLLLLGLVVLAGIALAVLTASNRKAEQAASEAADGSIPVLAIPSDTVRKIQMEARSGTLTLAYADGSWSLAEDPDYHLDESSCNAMLTAVSALNAKRELQEAAGEDYGFSAPQATVTITTDSGEETLVFGARNAVTGDVYLQKAGESAVYTVASSKLNCFLKDKAALFGAFSPAGLTSSAIEAVSYTRTAPPIRRSGGWKMTPRQTSTRTKRMPSSRRSAVMSAGRSPLRMVPTRPRPGLTPRW